MAQPQGCHTALYDTTCLLYPGGCVSVTVYPGHAEGIAEEQAVLEHAAQLPQGR